jgi:hypothetical protein
MTTHARFSPSGAHRWMYCPASIAVTLDEPRTSSEYAAEGTAAHDVAAQCLTSGRDADSFVGTEVEADGYKFAVTKDFASAVQVYIDSVRRRAEGALLLVEQKVEFSKAIGFDSQFGTSDAVIWDAAQNVLTVQDLKFGRGVKVYAEQNEQAQMYGVGTLETFGELLDIPDTAKVVLVISQPRLDHEDEWETTVPALREFAKRAASAAYNAQHAIAQAVNFGAEQVSDRFFQVTEKGCYFCTFKASCKAYEKTVAKAVFDDLDALENADALAVGPEPTVPAKGSELGAKYAVLGLIENWCRAVRAETEKRVAEGVEVIGADGLPLKVVEGRKGHRAWTDSAQAEAVLLGLLPVEKVYAPQVVLSPSKIAAILDKKKTAETWAVVKELITTPRGRPVVVLGSDPRPPYEGAASDSDFDAVED